MIFNLNTIFYMQYRSEEISPIPKSLWSTQVGQHPSGQHGSVQHSMNMLYMDSLQRGDQCSPGEKVGKPTKV